MPPLVCVQSHILLAIADGVHGAGMRLATIGISGSSFSASLRSSMSLPPPPPPPPPL